MTTNNEAIEAIADYARELGSRVTEDLGAPQTHTMLAVLTRLRAMYEELRDGNQL
jgi:hypothetical protein